MIHKLEVVNMRISLIWAAIGAALVLAASPVTARHDTKTPQRFPSVSTDEAWNVLRGKNPPLPGWALILVKSLPRTTAGMLQLDYLHRAKNPLGPVLAAKLQWTAADTLNCNYGRSYAAADLKRAGVDPTEFIKSAGDPARLSEPDRVVVNFARKMTSAAHTVTDEEVALLLKRFGPEKVVAMVHTLAWANFQYRVILGLGVQVEPKGPLPPLDPVLDKASLTKVVAPKRPPWKEAQKVKMSLGALLRPDWQDESATTSARAVELQKARQPRIPLPDASRFAAMPPDIKEQATKIVWSRVSMGYQPLLTQSWFETMQAFQQEADLDRVFRNSIFWIITRSNQCFY
jgi:alkylhydroperoxidase family enzyme